MTRYTDLRNKKHKKYSQYIEVYGEDMISEALAKPVIIHYANKIKPWDKPHSWLAKYWWQYAKQTSFPFFLEDFFM